MKKWRFTNQTEAEAHGKYVAWYRRWNKNFYIPFRSQVVLQHWLDYYLMPYPSGAYKVDKSKQP